MVSFEGIVIVIGWLISMGTALFIVPKLAADRTMRKFGLVKVENSRGDVVYAAADPDGEPIKVPVIRVDKTGKPTVTEEFCGLAYSLPTIAAMQIKASFTGKVGKLTQQANEAVLAGMPLNEAAQAMALQAFAKGQYGKALMAYLTPKIAAALNQSGMAAQHGVEPVQTGHRGRGPI